MPSLRFLLCLLLLLLSSLFAASQPTRSICYLPNGELAKADGLCWNSSHHAPTGLCCEQGDQCISNALCASGFEGMLMYYRGGCLDSTWSSPSCPNFCVSSEHEKKTGVLNVYRCADDNTGTQWYCGDNPPPNESANCSLYDGSFTLSDNVTAYATAGEIPQSSHATASSPVQASSATGDTSTDPAGTRTVSVQGALQPSSVTTPTGLSTTSIQSLQGALQHSYTIHPAGAVIATVAPTTSRQDPAVSSSPTAAPSSSTPQVNGNDDNASPAVPIGVGVAFGASIMIAAGVLGFFYLRKRRRETPVRAETPPPFEFSVMDSQAPGRMRPFWEAPGNGNMGTRLPELRGGAVRCELP